MKKRTLVALTSMALGVSMLLAGCGSTTDTGSTTKTASALTAEAQTALAAAYKGIMGEPDSTPVTPKAGVKLYIMSCGQSVTGCSTPTASLKEAGEAIGWKVTVTDGQLNPTGFATAIRQAVSGGADVLIPVGIDCAPAEAAFTEAKKAGIVIVGGGGQDNCPKVNGENVWSSARLWMPGKSGAQQMVEAGKLQAQYLIGKTNGKAKVLLLNFTSQDFGKQITQGFTDELKSCSGCSIVKQIDISDNDWIDNSATQKFSTALLSASTANAVALPVDGWFPQGIASAIVQSGRSDSIVAIGRGGDVASNELIANNGGQDATIGYAAEWGAWGSVDTAARLLAGQKAPYVGEALQAIDKDHNLPKTGQAYQGMDFRSIYLKAWGK